MRALYQVQNQNLSTTIRFYPKLFCRMMSTIIVEKASRTLSICPFSPFISYQPKPDFTQLL